jgi:hypothetical protein
MNLLSLKSASTAQPKAKYEDYMATDGIKPWGYMGWKVKGYISSLGNFKDLPFTSLASSRAQNLPL